MKNENDNTEEFNWAEEFPQVCDENGTFIGFDIVMGNPPYGFLNEFLKEDLYLLFIKLSAGIAKNKKHISFIVPTSWQTSVRYKNFREELFKTLSLTNIVNLPFDVFSEAYVDTCIISLINNLNRDYSIEIINFDKKDKIKKISDYYTKRKQTISFKNVINQDYAIYTNNLLYDLFNRYKADNFYQLGEISKSRIGVLASKYDIRNSKFKNSDPYFEGNINRYIFKFQNEKYIDITRHKNNYKRYFFGGNKIWIRRIVNRQNRIMCTIPEKEFVTKKDIYVFTIESPTINTKYLLGVLNSKFISYLYLNSSMISTKDDFRQTTLTELRKLPIPKISEKQQQSIAELVDKLLVMKQKNRTDSFDNLENKLDKQIYKLYGLTKEEIAAVEKYLK